MGDLRVGGGYGFGAAAVGPGNVATLTRPFGPTSPGGRGRREAAGEGRSPDLLLFLFFASSSRLRVRNHFIGKVPRHFVVVAEFHGIAAAGTRFRS